MDFNIPEDLKMLQTLARDFVREQLIPLEKEVLGRDSDLEGARGNLTAEKEAGLVRLARETGLWGLGLPENLGGPGLGVLGMCLVEEELARTVLPFNNGSISPLLYECSQDQKPRYLTPLIEGSKSTCLALVEPGESIDPYRIKMKAHKEDGNFILDGRKMAYTRKGKIDFAIVFALTDADKGLRSGVTCFLVDSGTDGFTIQSRSEKTGWRAQVIEPLILTFTNCRVPAQQILGEEGRAFHLGKKWLPVRRIIRGARCAGAASRLLEKASEHANSWVSFGQPISNWPLIQSLLAEMAVDIEASRLMVYQAACQADEGREIHSQAAGVKVFTTEMLKRVADKAVLIKNGPGPLSGLTLEYLCQSLLRQNIGTYALEAQKSVIAGEVLKLGKIP